MSNYLFTSEAVAVGHPDKMADQISDAILDACLEQDPDARVACETLICSGLVILAGEISTKASINYQDIVRNTIKEIGYDSPSIGFDYQSCGIVPIINKQSPDIAIGVDEGTGEFKEQGAGDQGIMFGFACKETPELMPLPIMLSYKISEKLKLLRESKILPYLRPDGKTQVTVDYDKNHNPIRIHTVVLSTQHTEDVDQKTIKKDMIELIQSIAPKNLLDDDTLYYINPTGRFVLGGPSCDAGLTGRKIIIDTYGGMGRHGGGAFSGKDPSKVDRSGAYAARYVAKNIVAAKLATRCEIQVSYAIGISRPISIKVNCFDTEKIDLDILTQSILKVFDLSPKGIEKMLNLKRPIYKKTSYPGHFGRNNPDFSWEKTDQIEALLEAVNHKVNV